MTRDPNLRGFSKSRETIMEWLRDSERKTIPTNRQRAVPLPGMWYFLSHSKSRLFLLVFPFYIQAPRQTLFHRRTDKIFSRRHQISVHVFPLIPCRDAGAPCQFKILRCIFPASFITASPDSESLTKYSNLNAGRWKLVRFSLLILRASSMADVKGPVIRRPGSTSGYRR